MHESSRLELSEKFWANKFALSDAEDETSGPLNMRYSRFTFVENTICNLPKVPRAKFLVSERLFCFISICKLAASRTLL